MFGATYSYTNQITYTPLSPATPPPPTSHLQGQLAGHIVSTKPKNK